MYVWFILLGMLGGSLLGGPPGALVGSVLGWVIAKLIKSSAEERQLATPPFKPTQGSGPEASRTDLEERVQTLERQVSALQATVARLSSSHAAVDATVEAPWVPEFPVEPPRPITPLSPAATEPEPAPEPGVFIPELPTPISDTELTTQALALRAEGHQDFAETLPSPISEPEPTHSWARAETETETSREPIATPEPWDVKDYIPERLRPFILGGNTFVKIGVLILFLGLGFLLSYVAEQITVPIELRYAGVALVGAALLALGWRLRDHGDAAGGKGYGLILQGAGVGVFYLTTLAAMKLHPLLPPTAGFAIMVAVTAFSAVLAVAQNAPWLAMVASAAGFATPVLVSTGNNQHIALFSYLAILDLGILAMAWFKAWRPLNLIGFVGTFTLAAAWAKQHYSAALYPSTQAFLLLFFLMFTAIGVLFARRALALGDEPDASRPLSERATEALRQVGRVDSALVFGVPLTAYGLQYQMVRDDPWLPALSAMVLALFYVFMGRALWRGRHTRYALLGEAYVVVGVLFGTLSIPLALEGVWTGATWAVEAASMYWLCTRQQRPYTRAFALALLGAAGVRTLSSLGWDATPSTPLLTGSLLGMVMLALSALTVALVQRRAMLQDPDTLHPEWDKAGVLASWWLAVIALAVLPWMLLTPTWASVSMALMSVASMTLAQRAKLPVLSACAAALQIVAIGGFASTWHQLGDQAMLANGVEGLSAALIIGASMLVSAWLSLRDTWPQDADPAQASSMPPTWTLGSSVGLFVGLALISGAALFIMPAGQAALIWPVLGLVILRIALRLAHPALSLMWCVLTAASAMVFLAMGPALWPLLDVPAEPAAWAVLWGGLAWWTPLLLTLSGVVAGAWLHDARQRTQGWRMPWVDEPVVHVSMVVWSLAWWSQTLPPEIWRHLQLMHLMAFWPADLVLWVTATSVLLIMLAQWRRWPQMGMAAGWTIPAWVAVYLVVPVSAAAPSAFLGWLAWPLALLWHAILLRRAAAWWPMALQRVMHVAGFWLFAWLASREVQSAADRWTDPGSAWQALAWVLVPLALLAAMARQTWRERWPLKDFAVSYRVVASLPLVIGLVFWLVWSMRHEGRASPLPYVPVLNPLELGQGLVLASLALWVRALPEVPGLVWPSRAWRIAALSALGFALLTSMILRSCHHLAGVAWNGHALFHSTLTQAALSVTWALLGVGLMLRGHRQVQRAVWAVGAGLLGVVVVKLFFVELADRGGLYRVVSFIAVGLLLLLVGYFAPVPPERQTPTPTDKEKA